MKPQRMCKNPLNQKKKKNQLTKNALVLFFMV